MSTISLYDIEPFPRPEYKNIRGERIIHTPDKFPYSFDPYCIFKDSEYDETDPKDIKQVFTDRMKQWDIKLYEYCCKKVFGKTIDCFSAIPSEMVQDFISNYFTKSVKILGLEIGCNVSNGYPYWIIYYKEV